MHTDSNDNRFAKCPSGADWRKVVIISHFILSRHQHDGKSVIETFFPIFLNIILTSEYSILSLFLDAHRCEKG